MINIAAMSMTGYNIQLKGCVGGRLRSYQEEYTERWGKHGAEAVDDYMELYDELDNFEVIAKRLARLRPLLR